MRSRLLDKGQEEAEFFPSVTVVNRRGERTSQPSAEGIKRRVTVSGDEQAIAELAGDVSILAVKLLCREVPGADHRMRVKFRGQMFDLAMPPHFSSGASRATRHMAVVLRGRNEVGERIG